jgi:hypothetical protein
MRGCRNNLDGIIAGLEGFILELHPARRVNLCSVVALGSKRDKQPRLPAVSTQRRAKKQKNVVSLASFLARGPGLLQRPESLGGLNSTLGTLTLNTSLRSSPPPRRRPEKVEFEEVFDTLRIVSNRLSRTRLVVIRR